MHNCRDDIEMPICPWSNNALLHTQPISSCKHIQEMLNIHSLHQFQDDEKKKKLSKGSAKSSNQIYVQFLSQLLF